VKTTNTVLSEEINLEEVKLTNGTASPTHYPTPMPSAFPTFYPTTSFDPITAKTYYKGYFVQRSRSHTDCSGQVLDVSGYSIGCMKRDQFNVEYFYNDGPYGGADWSEFYDDVTQPLNMDNNQTDPILAHRSLQQEFDDTPNRGFQLMCKEYEFPDMSRSYELNLRVTEDETCKSEQTNVYPCLYSQQQCGNQEGTYHIGTTCTADEQAQLANPGPTLMMFTNEEACENTDHPVFFRTYVNDACFPYGNSGSGNFGDNNFFTVQCNADDTLTFKYFEDFTCSGPLVDKFTIKPGFNYHVGGETLQPYGTCVPTGFESYMFTFVCNK